MAENYSKQSEGELEKLLIEKQKALRDARFGSAGGKSANVKESRERRKDVARIMTALTAAKKK